MRRHTRSNAWFTRAAGSVPAATAAADPLATLRGLQQSDFQMRTEAIVVAGPELGVVPTRPSSATIAVDTPHRVAVDATLHADGLLVLLDAWYPGWSVRVDGAPAALVRANHAFRGVALKAGTHRVEFRYSCAPFRWGLLLALLGLAGIAALWWRSSTQSAEQRL